MTQLIFHLIGDYITQNEWMANTKTKNTLAGALACYIHAMTYSLPFLFIGSYTAVVVIFITHYFIDRERLAIYLIKLKNWNWKSKNYGFNDDTPVWLSTWLLIIIDNIMHIVCNYLALKYL